MTKPADNDAQAPLEELKLRKAEQTDAALGGLATRRAEELAGLRRRIDAAVNLVRALNEVLNPVQEAWLRQPEAPHTETRFGPADPRLTPDVDWSKAPADVRAWQQVIRALESLQPGTFDHEIRAYEERRFK